MDCTWGNRECRISSVISKSKTKQLYISENYRIQSSTHQPQPSNPSTSSTPAPQNHPLTHSPRTPIQPTNPPHESIPPHFQIHFSPFTSREEKKREINPRVGTPQPRAARTTLYSLSRKGIGCNENRNSLHSQ